MILDEARQVAVFVGQASRGCGRCAKRLLEALDEAFPEFTWVGSWDDKDCEIKPERIVRRTFLDDDAVVGEFECRRCGAPQKVEARMVREAFE